MAMTTQQLADLMPDTTQLESDEPQMESALHYQQLALLVSCLEWLWRDQDDFFIGANLTIFFSTAQLKDRDFRGPDFFLVRPTSNRPRKSWVVWEEGGQYPAVIIELLSDATAKVDRTLKKELYQDRFRTPEYYWFSPETLEFKGHRLIGHRYEDISPNPSGWLWSEVLGLYLGVKEGQLRYFHKNGDLVPTPQEAAVQAQADAVQSNLQAAQADERATQADERATQADERAAQADERAARLAEQLKALGIEPNV